MGKFRSILAFAMVAMIACLAAPAFAGNGCASGVCQVQQFAVAHYAPVVQQVQVQPYYAPIVQRQAVVQFKQQAVVQKQRAFVVQRHVAPVVQFNVQPAQRVTQRRGLFGRRITRVVE